MKGVHSLEVLVIYFFFVFMNWTMFYKGKFFSSGWPGSFQQPQPLTTWPIGIKLLCLTGPFCLIVLMFAEPLQNFVFGLYYQARLSLESDLIRKARYSLQKDLIENPAMLERLSPEKIQDEIHRRAQKFGQRKK